MPPHQLYPKGHNYARHYIDQHRCVGLCDCYGEGYAGRECEGERKRERERERERRGSVVCIVLLYDKPVHQKVHCRSSKDLLH